MSKTTNNWERERRRRLEAAALAEDILQCHGILEPPIDPACITTGEHQLCLIGDDFKDVFDGRLEYHPSKRRFLLFYNTKYDVEFGRHHPRTRFSIGHELGHFFLDHHRMYLIRGGRPHGSRSEFASLNTIEREADAFAAGLLMPTYMLKRLVNRQPITLSHVEEFAGVFETSLVSMAIRSVELSDFPCAAIGIRQGEIVWGFLSSSLREGGCYSALKGPIQSSMGREAWGAFQKGSRERLSDYTASRHWFRTFDREYLHDLTVLEEFIPVPAMHTLIAFLTIREEELYPGL